ncbi:4-hydroxy-tetrahydrodipicolinate synthase [Paenibacillus tarimensis]
MLRVEGIIPAVVTPFDERENLNEDALRVMVRRLIEAGVHGLFCLGTNGEFFSLSFEEKVRITEIIAEEAKGKIPVYAGAGCVSTRETVLLAKRLEAAGADALSVITPYFLSFSQQELIDHYKKVADATSLPVLLYNIPARTGNSLQPKSVSRLAEVPNVVGIKDSSGNYDLILEYIERTPPEFAVLSGTDSLILSTLMAGGKGAVASTANVFPETVVSIYEHWKTGDYGKAEEAQRVLRALRDSFALGTLPSVLKQFLNLMGLPAGPARGPVNSLTPQAEEELMRIVENYRREGRL